MRLINTHRFLAVGQEVLVEFSDEDIPPYAILSHTWDKDELLFDDIKQIESIRTSLRGGRSFRGAPWTPMSLDGTMETHARHTQLTESHQYYTSKLGYQKVESACKRAVQDFLDYLWVDTCCIDKSSSSELQEAINSMWQWYKESEICYVHLGDFHGCPSSWKRGPPQGNNAHRIDFQPYRWFWRGWTLQELLAPRQLLFFSREWALLGNLEDLSDAMSTVTKINIEILLHRIPISEVSVATRMSWAAGRKTSRVEDRAYSLLGIFQVNMPMLYGEKERAFLRLQEEILRMSTDQSILAWGRLFLSGTNPNLQEPLLAQSPDDFLDSPHALGRPFAGVFDHALEMTSAGLRIQTYLIPSSEPGCYRVVLNSAPHRDADGWLCTLSVHGILDGISAGLQQSFYINSAAKTSILDETGAKLYAPEPRLDRVSIGELLDQKKRLITILRGSWSDKPYPHMSISHGPVDGIRLQIVEELQVIDALPKSWMRLEHGKLQPGRARDEDVIFEGLGGNGLLWEGMLKLRDRNGTIVIFFLHADQSPLPREHPVYAAGFRDVDAWDTKGWVWAEKKYAGMSEFVVGKDIFTVRLPDLASRKPTFVVYQKDQRSKDRLSTHQ